MNRYVELKLTDGRLMRIRPELILFIVDGEDPKTTEVHLNGQIAICKGTLNRVYSQIIRPSYEEVTGSGKIHPEDAGGEAGIGGEGL